MFAPWKLWSCCIAMIIVGSTLPWTEIEFYPGWDRVQWVPFTVITSVRRLALDIVINIGIYLPFGYFAPFVMRERSRLTRLVIITFLALILSTAIETYQVFNPYRYPTVADIIMNVTGAVVGATFSLFKSIYRPAFLATQVR